MGKTKEEVFGRDEEGHARGMTSCLLEVNGEFAVATSDGKCRKKMMHGEYRHQPNHSSGYCIYKSGYKSYRRMLCIPWTEHVTSEEVFNMANTKPTSLMDYLNGDSMAFHGHLVRKGGITLDLMIRRLHGTRPRGRPITAWLKDLATQANINYKEAITTPRDRNKCRSIGNPRRAPDE